MFTGRTDGFVRRVAVDVVALFDVSVVVGVIRGDDLRRIVEFTASIAVLLLVLLFQQRGVHRFMEVME